MNKTAESPVAESVKLCIELDKELESNWNDMKAELEGAFEYVHGVSVSLTNTELIKGLLYCFDLSIGEAANIFFARLFDKEEIEGMHRRKF